jgi:predicted DNA-binding protein (MmcQ/YjbR family)
LFDGRAFVSLAVESASRRLALFIASQYQVNLEQFREYCLSKSHATEDTPFGPEVLVFKVGGKMFALAALDEVPTRVNLKCDPDLALELRDRYEQVTPGYHMNKRHWNTVEIEEGVPDAELRKMIDHSYDLVVKGLPRPRAKVAARSRRKAAAARRGRR